MENPVCNPSVETNRNVPSVEYVFIVFLAVVMISLRSIGASSHIGNSVNMVANKIHAIPC